MDTLIIIPNDKLLQMIDHQIAILDAFKQADQVLMQGVSGITDLITTPGLINLDFADVKAVMSNAGSALMGIGSARGEDRARAAAEMAVSSPLLEASIDGAHGVLLSIAGGSDLGLFEVSAAANLIQDAAHEDANIIFGTVIDDALGDEVRVTVIAAGFEGGQPPRRQPGISRAADLRSSAGDRRPTAGTAAEPVPSTGSGVRRSGSRPRDRPSSAGRRHPARRRRPRRRRPRRTGLPEVAGRGVDAGRTVPSRRADALGGVSRRKPSRATGDPRTESARLGPARTDCTRVGLTMAERLKRAAAWLGLVTDDRYGRVRRGRR